MAGEVRNVTLDPYEVEFANQVGLLRRMKYEGEGLAGGHGISDTSKASQLSMDQAGARAELAFCKFLGVYWKNAYVDSVDKGEYPARDCGGYEVRSTNHISGHLILHDRDPDDAPFALVITPHPSWGEDCHVYWLPGIVRRAADGKKPEFWEDTRTRNGCYFVPQSALVPWEEE